MTDRLRTERLLLRQPQLADAAVRARHLNNPEVPCRLGTVPYPVTDADAVNLQEVTLPRLDWERRS